LNKLLLLLLILLVILPSIYAFNISSNKNVNSSIATYIINVDSKYYSEYQWYSRGYPIYLETDKELDCSKYWKDECKPGSKISVKLKEYKLDDWEVSNIITIQESIINETSITCEIGTPELIYGEYMCIVNKYKLDDWDGIVNETNITCELGTPELIYGEYMCIVNKDIEYGIDKEYIEFFNYPIKNIGVIIWPSQPIGGWIVIIIFLLILSKVFNITGKNLREKFDDLIGR